MSFLYTSIFLACISVTLQLIWPLLILLHLTSFKVDIYHFIFLNTNPDFRGFCHTTESDLFLFSAPAL